MIDMTKFVATQCVDEMHSNAVVVLEQYAELFELEQAELIDHVNHDYVNDWESLGGVSFSGESFGEENDEEELQSNPDTCISVEEGSKAQHDLGTAFFDPRSPSKVFGPSPMLASWWMPRNIDRYGNKRNRSSSNDVGNFGKSSSTPTYDDSSIDAELNAFMRGEWSQFVESYG